MDSENAGVKHAEVITARLLQDERGWLRLAGWIKRAADLYRDAFGHPCRVESRPTWGGTPNGSEPGRCRAPS